MASACVELVPIGSSVADRLVEAGRDMARSQHRLVVLAAEFEESSEWWCSFATPAHWIVQQLDVCVSTAREWIRIGKALRTLPGVDAASAGQRLSYAKARALTRLAQPETEIELIELTRSVPAGRPGHALTAWTQRHEDHAERTARHQQDRSLRHRVEPDGTVTVTLRVPPEDAQEVLAAVEANVMRRAQASKSQCAAAPAADGDEDASAGAWESLAQQRADALVELVTDGGARVQTEIVLHVRGNGCTFDDGTPVTDTVVERLAPDGSLRALIHDAQGRPINASSRRRHPSARQKRVIKERDRCCVDCGPPSSSNTTVCPASNSPATPSSRRSGSAAPPATDDDTNVTDRDIDDELGGWIRCPSHRFGEAKIR